MFPRTFVSIWHNGSWDSKMNPKTFKEELCELCDSLLEEWSRWILVSTHLFQLANIQLSSWQLQFSSWQFLFSRFSSPKILGPFWGPKQRFFGILGDHGLLLTFLDILQMLYFLEIPFRWGIELPKRNLENVFFNKRCVDGTRCPELVI